MSVEKYMEQMNRVREEKGFRTIDEIDELAKENTIFNLFAVLISISVSLGKGNIISPNVTIENSAGTIIIGENNILFRGTTIQNLSGKIEIGMVINGNGTMTADMMERQEKYHPNWIGEQ